MSASSDQEALSKAADSDRAYDLIISDLAMPSMDGFAMLAELRKLSATATTPAIALSGFTRAHDVHGAPSTDYDAHASKPVVLDDFLASAARLVD